ncbi:MAG: winged helix-turn-helix domain-containing protein [Acidobacteriota bacterium]|nr:winged helix-turn-helix domain-containing protein [Acidobacteriota bacterium]
MLISYEFGPFLLDLSERLLLRDGKAVPLAPKVFETLVILVEHGGRIVDKDELIERLWPDSFVEESSLAQNIFQVRKALEGGAPGRRYVETIPKRGYRFAAEVREIAAGDAAALPPRLVSESPSGKTAEQVLAVRSLAVLPFKALGGEDRDKYLGLGMADATIIKLSGLRHLSVVPTSAVFKYAGRKYDSLAAGRKLGVDAVLEGAVQRAGERVRVTVQLIALADGRTLWSGKFDDRLKDIFDVQDSISEQVADALSLQMTGDERRHLRKRYTENTEAYQAYLMGVFFWNKRSNEGLNKAVEYFRQAITKDPAYALAYAGLADTYFLLAYRAYDSQARKEGFEKSRASALRALELDSFVAEAHTALATVKVKYDRDSAAAERSFRLALAINPNCAMAYSRYTWFLAAMGRLDESLHMMRRAQELDPLSPDANSGLANILYFAREYDEAIRYCQRALALEPNFLDALLWLGLSYEQKGMYAEAVAQFTKAKGGHGDSTEPSELLGHVFAVTGRRDDARAVLAKLNTAAQRGNVRPYNVALIHAALGQTRQAFEWLGRPYINWTERLRMLRFDPRMDDLRGDSRFTGVFERPPASGGTDLTSAAAQSAGPAGVER